MFYQSNTLQKYVLERDFRNEDHKNLRANNLHPITILIEADSLVKSVKCPIEDCGKESKNDFDHNKHLMIKKHHRDIECYIDRKWITLRQYHSIMKIYYRKNGMYNCLECHNQWNRRLDNVDGHFANTHPNNVQYVVQRLNTGRVLSVKPGRKIKFQKAIPTKYIEFLESAGHLEDQIVEVFSNETKIRKYLKMSQDEVCCDGMVLYLNGKYAIIEEKNPTNVFEAKDQLESVAKAIERKGSETEFAIIMGKKIKGISK
ncbi:MAG: hypothetical protein HeimC2_23640 [Candidatus Heimdallarchaeota archaeon LC_2]|nr:MAG: hypothetical protein HeimC2_23640 [Candidatus Heimdallarchaeota archaeon LC_2]